MITAHLPSGYVLAKSMGWRSLPYWAALIGAIVPDFDLIWFYLVDQRAFHHHRYWVHIPFFWALVAIVTLPLIWRTRFRKAALAFFMALFVHLVLDSIGGGIMWLAPINDTLYALVTVPPAQSHWVLSFILHWTFLLELCIWVWAGIIFLKSYKSRRTETRMPLDHVRESSET